MRPRYWLLALVVLAGGAVAVTAQFRSATSPQPGPTPPPPNYLAHPPQYFPPSVDFRVPVAQATPETQVAAPAPVAPQLPVAQAVLFSSGVGYFQREGLVEGTARVDLSFPVRDVNDLLKSMVVRDLDGGHIGAVSYDSNAPVEKTLNSFAINLTGNPSLAAILNQARGEKVEVQTVSGGTFAGCTVVGVETQKVAAGKETVECEVLNVSCADGLRSFKMSEVQRVRFLNPVMDSEFRKALETLALSHDTQKKAVSINFVGDGKRQVRVGYVVENPVWKTSYRLVLGKEKDAKPYLQGWAVVENVSDEDWKDVRVALVSGRPISFQMDLYQPLFVPRPTVTPELFASLQPRVYNGSIMANERLENKGYAALNDADRGDISSSKLPSTRPLAPVTATAQDSFLSAPVFNAPLATAPPPPRPVVMDSTLSLQNGVSAAAQAAKLGDFFQYVIQHPVTLPRQKSAMLPIVGKDVEATRVSVYNEATLARHPLLGVRLKNTTGLHLMQGPITVFEDGSYAGDARILDLQPNEKRLLSYAIDLGTEVNPVASSDDGRLKVVKAVKGIIYTTTKVRETKTYTITNRNDAERTVLVEHPVRNDFNLEDTAEPAEPASDFYRFQVKVPAGKTDKQVVTEERIIYQSVALTNLDDNSIHVFIQNPVSSPKVKEGLDSALKLRWAVAKTQQEIRELERQLDVITQDQVRLRANLKEMPATAAAYKRYLEKFDAQETQIEKYQADIKKLQGVEHSQKKEFDDFLANFNAE